MKMGTGRSSVIVDCVRTKMVAFSGAGKPGKESDRGAWRHNELSPPSMTASTRRRLSNQKAPSGSDPGGEACKLCGAPNGDSGPDEEENCSIMGWHRP